ncbi:hypothetical protein BT67DRAFT_170483 [Trichocladium antarcticum]|uniref:Uncharacterized protein n=1 Tax=Trichocladium antarcticum TaxID=1450529 RepID=A0AAN6ZAS2_9PEZI|nr:hypothetical protein BT67DRAFT_170483 [Trichocladium antarcticum]
MYLGINGEMDGWMEGRMDDRPDQPANNQSALTARPPHNPHAPRTPSTAYLPSPTHHSPFADLQVPSIQPHAAARESPSIPFYSITHNTQPKAKPSQPKPRPWASSSISTHALHTPHPKDLGSRERGRERERETGNGTGTETETARRPDDESPPGEPGSQGSGMVANSWNQQQQHNRIRYVLKRSHMWMLAAQWADTDSPKPSAEPPQCSTRAAVCPRRNPSREPTGYIRWQDRQQHLSGG